jgi:hypothetical protein
MFIVATFVPSLVVIVSFGPLKTAAFELPLIFFGGTLMMIVGVWLGLWIRPLSAYAGLVVLVSPVVTVAAWTIAFVSWALFFQQGTASTILRSLFMLCLGLPIFALPTAGIVRGVHWMRDRQS